MLGLLLAPDGSLGSHRACAALLGVGGIARPEAGDHHPSGSSLRRAVAHRARVDRPAAGRPPQGRRDPDHGSPPTRDGSRSGRLAAAVPPGDAGVALAARGRVPAPAPDLPAAQAIGTQRRRGAARLAGPLRRGRRRRRIGLGAARPSTRSSMPASAPCAQHWVEVEGGARYRFDLAFPRADGRGRDQRVPARERPAKRADARRRAVAARHWVDGPRVWSDRFASDLFRAIAGPAFPVCRLSVTARPHGETKSRGGGGGVSGGGGRRGGRRASPCFGGRRQVDRDLQVPLVVALGVDEDLLDLPGGALVGVGDDEAGGASGVAVDGDARAGDDGGAVSPGRATGASGSGWTASSP